ncbi:MAG: hypothetical protein NXI15_13855 [Gammaproteobacteria bacterium]|nr:hypothetical protein [Gammaproteobacteria bacterium]
MSQENSAPVSLAQRVNSYLRTEEPGKKIFAVKETADEVQAEEYLLQRAEEQLNAAQLRVDRLRQRVLEKKANLERATRGDIR